MFTFPCQGPTCKDSRVWTLLNSTFQGVWLCSLDGWYVLICLPLCPSLVLHLTLLTLVWRPPATVTPRTVQPSMSKAQLDSKALLRYNEALPFSFPSSPPLGGEGQNGRACKLFFFFSPRKGQHPRQHLRSAIHCTGCKWFGRYGRDQIRCLDSQIGWTSQFVKYILTRVIRWSAGKRCNHCKRLRSKHSSAWKALCLRSRSVWKQRRSTDLVECWAHLKIYGGKLFEYLLCLLWILIGYERSFTVFRTMEVQSVAKRPSSCWRRMARSTALAFAVTFSRNVIQNTILSSCRSFSSCESMYGGVPCIICQTFH